MCGLVRDRAAASAKLDAFVQLRDDGVIDGAVVSWWRRESELYPDLVDRIVEEGFTLIELAEPKVKFSGHMIHQNIVLWYALQATPDDAMVLRTRPDLMQVDEAVRYCLGRDVPPPAPIEGWPDVFRERLVVSSVFPTSPYYINDILFFGLREDLLGLAGFDVAPEYIYNWSEAEHFLHSRASRRLFPLLDAYLQIHPPFWHGHPDRAAELLKAQLASDTYLDVLATHLHMLAAYYQLGWRPAASRGAIAAAFKSHTLEEILGSATGLAGCEFLGGPNVVAFTGPEPLQALLGGYMARGRLRDRFMAAVERTQGYAYIRAFGANPLRPHTSIVELAERLHAVRQSEDKLKFPSTPEARRFTVRGSPERVDALGETEVTKKLEAQIAEMRREIQRLSGAGAVAKPG